jgi:hypothetical protein
MTWWRAGALTVGANKVILPGRGTAHHPPITGKRCRMRKIVRPMRGVA